MLADPGEKPVRTSSQERVRVPAAEKGSFARGLLIAIPLAALLWLGLFLLF
jgi:hypothetical protein